MRGVTAENGLEYSNIRLRSSHRRWFFSRGPGSFFRFLETLKFLAGRDRKAVIGFLFFKYPIAWSFVTRIKLLYKFLRVTQHVRGYHTLEEILQVTHELLVRTFEVPSGLTMIEAGAGSGSSSAKLSLVMELIGGRLLVFDSFQGIPDNDEIHQLWDGRTLKFKKGAFKGRLEAVKKRVEKYGSIRVTSFVKGWFEESFLHFSAKVDVALLDVDLESSTKAVLKAIAPHLQKNACILSQDGHLERICRVVSDPAFWYEEAKSRPPRIEGLRHRKLIKLLWD